MDDNLLNNNISVKHDQASANKIAKKAIFNAETESEMR